MALLTMAMECNWDMHSPQSVLAAASTSRQVQRNTWAASYQGTPIRTAATPERLQRSIGYRVNNEEGYWDLQVTSLAFRLWRRAWGLKYEGNPPPGWTYNPIDANGVDVRDLNILRNLQRLMVNPRLDLPMFQRDFEGMPGLEVVEDRPALPYVPVFNEHLQIDDEDRRLYKSLRHKDTTYIARDDGSSSGETFW